MIMNCLGLFEVIITEFIWTE